MKLSYSILLVALLVILPFTGACTYSQERQQYEAFARDYEEKAIEAQASSNKYLGLWEDAMQKADYYKEQADTHDAQGRRYLDVAADFSIEITEARSQGRYEYANELIHKAQTYCDLAETNFDKAEEYTNEYDHYLSLANGHKAEAEYYAELAQEYRQQANHYKTLAEQ